MLKKQIFLSHNWGYDDLNRDNHERVNILKNILTNFYGWSVWFDEDDMGWNIDGSMLNGIRNSEIVLIFITKKYLKKIENSCIDICVKDNCAKEWNLVQILKKNFLLIIMEKDLLSSNNISFFSIIGMYSASHMYIDLTDDINISSVSRINNWLIKKYNLKPNNKINSKKQLLLNYYFNKKKKNFINNLCLRSLNILKNVNNFKINIKKKNNLDFEKKFINNKIENYCNNYNKYILNEKNIYYKKNNFELKKKINNIIWI